MSESRFSVVQNEAGTIVLAAKPAAGEEIAVGRLVDYLTPTGRTDQLNVATPDAETGEIRRTLAPDVTRPQLDFILDAAGYTLD